MAPCALISIWYSDASYKTSRYKPLHITLCCPASYEEKARKKLLRFTRRNFNEEKYEGYPYTIRVVHEVEETKVFPESFKLPVEAEHKLSKTHNVHIMIGN